MNDLDETAKYTGAYVPPAIPADEAQRLETLQGLDVLDTPVEERFDRLTRLARRLLDVPIALVSLVDENRQWFKSRDGLDASETPRDISFCGHAILGHEVFVIPDATKDERFAANPLVTGPPDIRFYAGYPLRAVNGQALGTLCIIDTRPRELDADDLASFRDLAGMAEQELATLQLATLDDLTRISNRRGFSILAENSLNLCRRQKVPAVLSYIDLNDFKPINDQFGHAAGDQVLMSFAEQMRHVFRDSDIFARLGGDEFAVLFTNATAETSGRIFARFDSAVDAMNRDADLHCDVSYSRGIVEFDPAVHHTVDALLAEADARMYDIKRKRNVKASTAS